ncbi:glutamate synthase (NADH) small subunit [Homoserinimonas aerilata]|uniref:Glutamate synthase (NADH) small subunit n=1 Tax=Homoserinimonas aerilata TaxID=1162970 RepID=A0A542YIV2_9MICO|nr:glutamate synthase subunit beta [Homoserinimonas aerilata]TQL47999.1 glutamate synthase (NADH) small subunit [Homoserinimonas aerilata]
MADPKGFLKTRSRELPARRPVELRLMDWKEVYEQGDAATLRRQAGRCMDCGVPFCHQGCPLGNLIPEWNDLMRRGEGQQAVERLHATNNFPEFTGRLCPAPCESSCVLGISQPPVTIKQVEVSIIDQAWANDWVVPHPPERLTGKTVAVVGSGPAGLAAAQQLTRAGHTVAVFERDDRIGGLLRYGIPDFKMEKKVLDQRLKQMQAEGTRFRAGVNIGVDIGWGELRERYDAVVIATGATVPRDLPIPGRDFAGVHFAMEYLVEQNRVGAGDRVVDQITAEGKHVVVLGGGDTGADCIGTAHRQNALSVTNLAIGTQPPSERPEHQPWPTAPTLFEVQSAHEEGGERAFLASTVEFLSNEVGEVRAIRVAETEYVDGRRVPKSGTEREIPADLVLLALGFTGAESQDLEGQLELQFDRGTPVRGSTYETEQSGVFVAGDAGRGQSLIVWAIAEGRAVASEVDRFLEGETLLPAPVRPTDRPISL